MSRALVIGTTGTQGYAVARHLLARGRFAVRALTRRPHAALARELEARGAEIVEGDLAQRESLRAALRGCQAVFGLASRHGSRERRDVLGLNLVNAVAGSAVDHFVLSDRQGHLEWYARSLQLPASYVRPAAYFERIANAIGRAPDLAAFLAAANLQPGSPLPGIASDDVGALVARMMERPAETLERTVDAVGDCRTARSYFAAWARQNRKTPGWSAVSPADGQGVADDVLHSHYQDAGEMDSEAVRLLHPEMQDFETWLRDHAIDFEETLATLAALTDDETRRQTRRGE